MRVFKWDDDLAVELPQELIDQMGLTEGDELVVVETEGMTVFVARAESQRCGGLRTQLE
jgi:antitoxin component of MazEF toxin-antitoxin module